MFWPGFFFPTEAVGHEEVMKGSSGVMVSENLVKITHDTTFSVAEAQVERKMILSWPQCFL